MPVLQVLDWYLPRFHDDGLASASERPDLPALDRQTFTSDDKKALLEAPWDIRAADRRWLDQYKVGIEDRKRRFLVSVALHLADSGADFARASKFYLEFIKDYPREVPLEDGKRKTEGGIARRTLTMWAQQANRQGWISLERGGDECGVEKANANEACLFYTSYQKHRLMIAAGALQPDGEHGFLTYRGKPLTGPSR